MEKQLHEWVDKHLPSKTNEDLWDLQAAILTELSRRDDVQYRVRASKESLDEKFREAIISKIPSARLGKADDIANAVLFLCSNKSNYINGETLHVNGGLYMA